MFHGNDSLMVVRFVQTKFWLRKLHQSLVTVYQNNDYPDSMHPYQYSSNASPYNSPGILSLAA